MMEKLRRTPSQTVGPFFAYALTPEQYNYDYNSILNGLMVSEETPGERICISGNIFDGNGTTIPDAMIELWQADSEGKYRTGPITRKNDGFTGIGRLGTGTDINHRFSFTSIKPGCVAEHQAPHINIILFMRGSLRDLYTRMYFPDEVNDNDPLLLSIEPERRHTLIAQRREINGIAEYVFNIYMQGENETVFFNLK